MVILNYWYFRQTKKSFCIVNIANQTIKCNNYRYKILLFVKVDILIYKMFIEGLFTLCKNKIYKMGTPKMHLILMFSGAFSEVFLKLLIDNLFLVNVTGIGGAKTKLAVAFFLFYLLQN